MQLPFLHSPDYVSTDSEEDHLHGYVMPVIRGHQLRIINIDGQLRCPINPGLANWQWTWDTAKNHILGIVNSNAQDNKKRNHHRGLAGNEGWFCYHLLMTRMNLVSNEGTMHCHQEFCVPTRCVPIHTGAISRLAIMTSISGMALILYCEVM